jgi:hypothetical protein
MEAEIPLFRSSHDALRFAYLFNAQQYAMTPMAKLMGGRGSGKGLVGVDGAAQAGMILGRVSQLPKIERYVIVARYSLGKEGVEAKMELILPVVASMPTGMVHRRMIDHLIQRYFGEKVLLGQLAGMFDVNPDTVTAKWRQVRDRLREIESRAQYLIADELARCGIVE